MPQAAASSSCCRCSSWTTRGDARSTTRSACGPGCNTRSNEQLQVEMGYEFKARRFSTALQNLQGDMHSVSMFANYALRADVALYGQLIWRDSDARMAVFAYRERIARLGVMVALGTDATMNLSYGYRGRSADAANAVFGKQQRDHENSIYVQLGLPGYAWAGLTPSVSYEYRNNSSTIAHAYNYEKSRLTLGMTKVF
ncbi:MAG: surface lipoprotein assembly modifier [Pseudorhodoferax sp.]